MATKYPKKINKDFFNNELNFNNLKFELLDNSFNWNMAHIPSALSMLRYLSIMVPLMKWKYPEYKWVAGKQFGQQAYYTIYKALKKYNLDELIPIDIETSTRPILLNSINKEFDYIEETLGNSLGVAIGMALSQKRPIWINLSDSVFQMGRVQEALRIISQYNLNIFITIDGNRCTRCVGTDSDAQKYYGNQQPAEFIEKLFETNKIQFRRVPAYSNCNINTIFEEVEYVINNFDGPKVIYFDTIKGDGFEEFEKDPVGWHYKKLTEQDYNIIQYNMRNGRLKLR